MEQSDVKFRVLTRINENRQREHRTRNKDKNDRTLKVMNTKLINQLTN